MAADPQDAPRHAGQVVRRVLLRRNIAIDAETAQLVAAAVQAALQTGAPSQPPPTPTRSRRRLRAAVLIWHRLSAACPQLPDNREPGRAHAAAFAQVAPRHGGRCCPVTSVIGEHLIPTVHTSTGRSDPLCRRVHETLANPQSSARKREPHVSRAEDFGH